MKKILCVLETPYRGTQEEQDDAVLWLTHALKNAGGEIGVLLRGNAVNYAVTTQDPSGITIGKLSIEHPCNPHLDLLKMQGAGIPVHIIREDAAERGIPSHGIAKDFKLVSISDLPALFSQYDQVWHW
jgi:hypothetical protein